MSTDEAFTVTNQLSTERPQVVAKELVQPSQPLSAYAMFFKETQASIKSEKPDASFTELKTIVDTMWQVLGEEQKKKYEERSAQDKDRYNTELLEYQSAKEKEHRLLTSAPRTVITPVPNSAPMKPGTVTPSPGAQTCIRLGCNKTSVRNVEWEDEYCSSQCVVLHCDFVFREWVRDQQVKA
jgi:hypothetical protein